MIKLLILSDVFVVGATAMLSPLLALFVEDYIPGAGAMEISIALGLYLLSRSLLQIPVATIIDSIKGERDDYLFLVTFSILSSIAIFLYMFVKTPIQLYALQILIGTFTAITYPSYMAIFTRHIDRRREGTEWGIYYTLTDVVSAFLAVIGGYIVDSYNFSIFFITVGCISLFGSLMIIPIRKKLKY